MAYYSELGVFALLGRGAAGVVFLVLGVAALILSVIWRRILLFVALIGIPAATAGFTGAVVWSTEDLAMRSLLIAAPIATAVIFVRERQGLARTVGAAVGSALNATAFFALGALVAFLALYQD
ncbi:MAG: hypothetical protein E6G36_09255 [Actinobacteria bacterium]|nr:MAG: hypothetical protein E6G36_09255 [Actinomycetota bacterium]